MTAPALLTDTQLLLDAALAAGDYLAQTAYWNDAGTECNWLSHRDIEDRELAPYSVRTAALSPEVYSGSAGVALFLAELFGVSGQPQYRELALAAWRRSASYTRRIPSPAPPVSFYAGSLGLAHVGLRLLALCPELHAQLQPEIDWQLAQVRDNFGAKHGLDVIGGNAGAIAPLLALARQPAYAFCHDLALACGDELVATAVWQGERCCWSYEKVHGMEMDAPPMTGFSHGAAGMALALLELYHATGRPDYLRTARGAFVFEEEFFSPTAGNWLDTRYPYTLGQGEPQGTFRHAWCHGAPGNALAYLRASQLDPAHASYYRQRAATAAATTQARLAVLLDQPLADATLCHGLCGLADILLLYGHTLGDEAAVAAALAATAQFAARYPRPAIWPSGLTTNAPCQGLLIGNAGVGLHLLRAYTQGAVPSVLLLLPS